ncbi:hypothetical protein M3Y97_00655400 [Aphelenchoides bicaudatus]|nr:hypothetical protein M3Y97_00655400 [Aphelenchoides bicaudatus]
MGGVQIQFSTTSIIILAIKSCSLLKWFVVKSITMAFYFALFNVSNVNQELKGRSRANKRERRRHSLATSSSAHVAKDYRLLPKPKIIFHDNTDNETVSTLVDESGDDETSGHHPFKYLEAKDSLKHRRASSPEGRNAMNTTLSNPIILNNIEERLKRVQLNTAATHSNGPTASSWTENQEEEQIWIKRNPSPTHQQMSTLSNEDPWVYSIELERRRQNIKMNKKPPLPEKHRPAMGVSALELRSINSQNEQNQLRADLRRHINTWPEVRASRTHWRPSLLLRRHSGGSLSDHERLVQLFQRRRGSGDNQKNQKSQIPYQSITPTSPPQQEASNQKAKPINSQKPPSKPKTLVVITPTSRKDAPSTSNFRSNFNSWTRQAIGRSYKDVPFVRLNNESFEGLETAKNNMIRSSVF